MATQYTYEDIITHPNLVAIQIGVDNSEMTDKDVVSMSWDEGLEELYITFVNSLSGGDKDILDTVVEDNKDAATLPPEPTPVSIANAATTSDNFIKMVQEPREGDARNFYSPNLCDPTTWYDGITEITEFSMTDSGDHTTYNTGGTHVNWVDLKHGRIFQEDDILAANPSYAVKIEVSTDAGVNWTEMTENSWGETDEDYTVNYAAGTVTFNSALGESDLVRWSGIKAPETFIWVLEPAAGKRLKLMYAEVQFSVDTVMNSSLIYETWVYNPYDLPNKIKITELKYKTFQDIMWESTGPFPVIPGIGGTSVKNGGRGIAQDICVIPFNYATFRDMRASTGVEVRVTSDKPGAFTGEFASVTFYCLSEDE